MLKALIILGWVVFSVDVFFVTAALITKNMGDDAAGRGVATVFGLISLVFVLAGGAGLYFSARSHSWFGAAGSILGLALPLVMLFGADVESYWLLLRSSHEQRKEGRYAVPAQRELAAAIKSADFAAMRRILATHPKLQGRDEAGWDLLSYAAMQTRLVRLEAENLRRLEGVRLLLDAGMDPNQSLDSDGGSPLVRTVHDLTEPMPDGWRINPVAAQLFQLLLAHGANPNVTAESQPLLFSAGGDPASLKAMLDHGATIEARDPAGNTALLFFLSSGRWDAALLLLERGAAVKVQNQVGTTAQAALANGKRQAAERGGALSSPALRTLEAKLLSQTGETHAQP